MKPYTHGEYRTYVTKRCRCELCRAASNVYRWKIRVKAESYQPLNIARAHCERRPGNNLNHWTSEVITGWNGSGPIWLAAPSKTPREFWHAVLSTLHPHTFNKGDK